MMARKSSPSPSPKRAPGRERLAYSYLRFSTPEQSKGDSHRRQTAAAAAYCATHGLRLVDDAAYHDLGVSAYRGANLGETGALGQFLRAVEDGTIPKGVTLLVENLDRVSRQSPRKAVQALERIVEAGVDVVTLSDGRTYNVESLDSDPFALVMAVMTFVRANEESRIKASRLRSAWAGKRQRASAGSGTGAPEKLTSIAPAWLSLDKDTGEWIVNEERAAIVRDIFKATLAGTGTEAIARTLNAASIAPWRRGNAWHRSYVLKILTNPAVVGRLQPHAMEVGADGVRRRVPVGEPLEGYYPAIIDPETFRAVQAQRDTSGKSSGKGGTVNNLIAGLGRCGRCGGTITRVMKGSGGKGGHAKLVCRNTLNGTGACNAPRVRQAEVEEAVWEIVLLSPDAIRSLAISSGSLASDIAAADEALTQARDVAASIADAFTASRDSSVLRDRLAAAEAEVERLSDHLASLVDRADTLAVPPERTLKELQALYPEREERRQECNALLRRLAAAVVVSDGAAVTVQWKSGAETDAFLWAA